MISLAIEPKNLTEAEKVHQEQVMRAGNVRLKYWHAQAKKSEHLSKKQLTRSRFRGKLFQMLDNGETNFALDRIVHYGEKEYKPKKDGQKRIPQQDINKIVAVRDMEIDILAGYMKMVAHLADHWNRRERDSSVTLNDLVSEGTAKLHDAIYYYTNDDRFSTFSWYAVNRRMITLCTKTTLLNDRTNEITKLLQKYDETRRSFNGPCNAEEIYAKMKLTPEQRSRLENARMGVVSQSILESPGNESDDDDCDYTYFAAQIGDYNSTGYQAGVGRIMNNRNEIADFDEELAKQLIELANLTEFESLVIQESLSASDDRWRAKFAATHKGPGGKHYSRAWISQTLKRAHAKVRTAADKLGITI